LENSQGYILALKAALDLERRTAKKTSLDQINSSIPRKY
jgi:hypothetical protein